MALINTKSLSDTLMKFYNENLSSGVNDLLDASQGFPPLSIEAKGAKFAMQAPEMAGVVSLAAAKNIPKLKALIKKKFGINPETLQTMRAESPYRGYLKGDPKLEYHAPRITSSEWAVILGVSPEKMKWKNLKEGSTFNLPILADKFDIPNRAIIQSFLGRKIGYDIDELANSAFSGVKEYRDYKDIPKKYRNVITKIKQWEKTNVSRANPSLLREHLLDEIMKQEGIQNLFLGTKKGLPSQFISVRE